MSRPNAEDPLLNAVQETLGEYHRQIEEIDEELSRLVHRREEFVAGARLAVIEQLPEEVRSRVPETFTAGPPEGSGLPGSEHVAELAAATGLEAGPLRERLQGFHQEIESVDTQLASLVHKREEVLASARLALVDRVPHEVKGRVADLAPRVAMALACR